MEVASICGRGKSGQKFTNLPAVLFDRSAPLVRVLPRRNSVSLESRKRENRGKKGDREGREGGLRSFAEAAVSALLFLRAASCKHACGLRVTRRRRVRAMNAL